LLLASCNVSVDVPSPTVRGPAMALVPLALFRNRVPPSTVVVPVNVLALVSVAPPPSVRVPVVELPVASRVRLKLLLEAPPPRTPTKVSLLGTFKGREPLVALLLRTLPAPVRLLRVRLLPFRSSVPLSVTLAVAGSAVELPARRVPGLVIVVAPL